MSRDFLILTPPERPLRVAELPYSVAEDDFAPSRDVLLLSEPAEDAELAKQRAELESEILRQRGDVSAEITRLTAENHEGELDEQIARLGGVLRMLDADLAAARYGSAQMVASMVAGISAQSDAIRQTAGPAEARAQAGALMAEVTVAALEKLSIGAAYERLTAAHFSQMSDAQLDVIGRKLDAHVDRSLAHGRVVASEIEDLASRTGADLSAWRAEQDRLRAEEEEARRRGDKEALARIAYLNSTNDWIGAEEAGADAAYVEQRRQQMEEDRRAFALRLREQGAREAQEQGMTGKDAEEYIARREREGMAEADAERDQMVEQRRRMAAEREAEKKGLTGDAAARFVADAVENGADDPAVSTAVEPEQETAIKARNERWYSEGQEEGREVRAVTEVPVAENGTDVADAPVKEENKAAANPFGLPPTVAAAATASAAPLAGNQAAVEEQEKTEMGQLAAAASPAQPKTPSGEVGKG